MKEYIDRVELNKTFDIVCSNEVLRKQIGQYIDSAPTENVKEIIYAEWKMILDDFDDGVGTRELPHCSNCHRGVYKHDAGSWCPFCGAEMKNPMMY